MPSGGLISIAILLPNILWLFFPPVSIPAAATGFSSPVSRLLHLLEGVGRVAAFTIPFFCWIEVQSGLSVIGLIVLLGALAIYYAGWIRYFRRGREYAALFAPLIGVPVPMAISPVVCFLAASLVVQSGWLAMAAVTLGVGHIYLSWLEYRRLQERLIYHVVHDTHL